MNFESYLQIYSYKESGQGTDPVRFLYYSFTTFIGSPLTNALRFSSTIPTSLVLVSNPAHATCGVIRQLSHLSSGLSSFGGSVERTSTPRARYPAGVQCIGERLLVNNGAARGVYQNALGFIFSMNRVFTIPVVCGVSGQ